MKKETYVMNNKDQEKEKIIYSDRSALSPLVMASDIIRSFCHNFESCSTKCPLMNVAGRGFYFNNVTPDRWEVSELFEGMEIKIPIVINYSVEPRGEE